MSSRLVLRRGVEANAPESGVHAKACKLEAQGKVGICLFLWMAGFWMHQVRFEPEPIS